jgi:hypothetical protein
MFTRQYITRTLLLLVLFMTITPAGFLFTTWTTQLLNMKGFWVTESLTATTIISIGFPAGCFLASLVSDLGGRSGKFSFYFIQERQSIPVPCHGGVPPWETGSTLLILIQLRKVSVRYHILSSVC